jgi:leukotriene-A4 hydrolase
MKFHDPHSFADPAQGKITHIDFDIDVDFSQRVLAVEAIYHLDHPVNGSLFLDTRDLTIERIHTDGQDLVWEIDAHDPISGDRLHLKDVKSLSQFTIRLLTSPAASALQWLTPAQTAGKKHPFLYSQCQSIHARSIFPCQDSPSLRFTFQARLQVPSPLVAVMGAATTGTQRKGKHNAYTFRMDQPIPAYLFALAAGDIAFREIGPRTGIYAEPEVVQSAAWEFAENERKLSEGEKLFGPYLWDRYDVIIMPPSFPYGGMENPRLTFLSPLYILGDRTWTNVISHELAHAWTGNLVTNASWEHFWLNEGCTTYAEMRISEALDGFEAMQLDAAIYAQLLLEDMQLFGMDSNLTCLKTSLAGIDPDDVFSRIPYYKGYFFMRRLEEAVGRQRFDKFIRKYIEAYKFQTIATDEFIAFLRQELPEAFERVDVQSWVFEPGILDGALDVESRLYDLAISVSHAYKQGKLPQKDEIEGWISGQVYAFLLDLPESIPTEDCAYLDELFEFKSRWNSALQAVFLALSIRSGYREILARVERFVETIGRGIYLSRIFRAMIAEEWTRPLARPLFMRVRERHHPVTVAKIDGILRKAGL